MSSIVSLCCASAATTVSAAGLSLSAYGKHLRESFSMHHLSLSGSMHLFMSLCARYLASISQGLAALDGLGARARVPAELRRRFIVVVIVIAS